MAQGPKDEMVIDWRWKGFPPRLEGRSVREAAASGVSLLGGDFLMPAAVLKRSAIDRNVRAMRAFTKAAGVELCPHGKTSMSPELFAWQLEAGAWGMTAATAHHVRLYRRWDVERILLANQLIAPADIALVLDEVDRADFDFFCLVDSLAGAERLAEAVRRRGLRRRLNVLLEVGAAKARTGVRSIDEGVALGRWLAGQQDALALRGVEIFEGVHPFAGDGPAAAEAMLDDMRTLARSLLAAGCFAPGEIILTGGGSALFDLCVNRLAGFDLDGRAKVVLRSGCYITHDHGLYAEALKAIRGRAPEAFPDELSPMPALEVWAVVQSLPEPGLAIASLGKRDVGFDADLPRPIWRYRPGAAAPEAAGEQLRIVKLYDQHACLQGVDGLEIGDLLGFGVSHPCTTFDRWRAMAVVDDDYRLVDVVTTVF